VLAGANHHLVVQGHGDLVILGSDDHVADGQVAVVGGQIGPQMRQRVVDAKHAT
jgi:hypothetical protein